MTKRIGYVTLHGKFYYENKFRLFQRNKNIKIVGNVTLATYKKSLLVFFFLKNNIRKVI